MSTRDETNTVIPIPQSPITTRAERMGFRHRSFCFLFFKFLNKKLLYYFLVIYIFVIGKNSESAKMSCKFLKPSSLMERGAEYYTNTWAVRILGGVNKAKTVAKVLGYNFQKKISEGLPDIYLFQNHRYPKRTNYSAELITKYLNRYPKISWAEQQIAEVRKSRWLSERATNSELSWDNPTEAYLCPDLKNSNVTGKYPLNLNDKYWPQQYYLKNCGKKFDELPGDLNIAPAWVEHHLFGRNIKVIVVDDGVETKHVELVDNYNRNLGLDLEDNDKTPDPPPRSWNPLQRFYNFAHGTRCAGVIAMKGNNTNCGVGVAPSVTLGGLTPLTDYKISRALLFKHVNVHIMSNSWGPIDDGKWMPYLGPLTRAALKVGITKGREGRGLIYVFAAGNGKIIGDHCGADSLASSIYTISVASCDHRGMVTSFSEQCANIMVTTYSGSGSTLHNVISSDKGGDKCTTKHTGTSASTPMVAGAIALALEANPKLTWRDIHHLLAWTCQVAPLQNNLPNTWLINDAGFYVSHDFGFGLLDIGLLTENAKHFQSVGPMNSCVTSANLDIDGVRFCTNLEIEINTDGCTGTTSEVAYLEHVQLTVSLAYPKRGDIQIVLVSPSGTRATLLDYRKKDSFACGIRSWTFDSIMTWGESPKGEWKVLINGMRQKASKALSTSSVKKMWSAVKNKKSGPVCYAYGNGIPVNSMIGEVNDLTLTLHGTRVKPNHYKAGKRTYNEFELLNR